ncbi:tetraacyldisaccharide 4'-kinase [Undibacterium sp. Jales W-56]|uniref:tetraacyldisaccharide 4'-kinase n=1 Tax=Undibacterium sp. Jales W-56 TaxID=2897325 RepID=UPI0021D3E8A3|nr:tetraacyldisaccharide 4'-kinase [Undibacterium sp. Jales W-56]MCU6435549.1 tetraacyldisaccharide 4'-kinase [Undibacterium sp. Jales W-56]
MRVWMRRGVWACLFWPVAQLFQFLLGFRLGLILLGYQSQTRVAVPVIVVGNIFVGGTGKTPLVIYLVQQLRAAGWTPGVISRGYAAEAAAVTLVTADALAQVVGDEPLLIHTRTNAPVVVGRQRVAAAQMLLLAHPEVNVIISDDGLQHYALARDVEIVLFDQRGVGNGWLLPAGPLREPVQRRRDFTVVNLPADAPLPALGVPADAPVLRMQLLAGAVYQLCDPQKTQTLQHLASTALEITAVAGIGNPQRFFTMLAAAGVQCKGLPMPDHYAFHATSFAQITSDIILMTEKDAVKCRQLAALRQDARIWVVPVDAQLDPHFAQQIIELISEKQHGRTLA